MSGIEPAGLVADFPEGGLHDLFGRDRVAQDAEGQGPEAQGVACRQLRERENVPLGDPLQQGDIRDRLLPRRACLYDDACHVASLEWALGIKSPAAAGRSRTFFKLFTVRELARKLGRGEDERHTINARMGCSTRRNGSNTSPRISRVTTPSSASASPGWPRTTGVCPSPCGKVR